LLPIPSPQAPEFPGGESPEDQRREPARAAPVLADGALRRLDSRYVLAARLSGWSTCGVLFLVAPAGFLVVRAGEPWGAARTLLFTGAWAALGLAAFLFASLFPGLKYRHLSWRLSSAGLEIRRGVVFRHRISVPRTRVQHIDVQRGPIERRFGLASLVVHTAGRQDSEIRLEGLAEDTALALRDDLLATGEGDGS